MYGLYTDLFSFVMDLYSSESHYQTNTELRSVVS